MIWPRLHHPWAPFENIFMPRTNPQHTGIISANSVGSQIKWRIQFRKSAKPHPHVSMLLSGTIASAFLKQCTCGSKSKICQCWGLSSGRRILSSISPHISTVAMHPPRRSSYANNLIRITGSPSFRSSTRPFSTSQQFSIGGDKRSFSTHLQLVTLRTTISAFSRSGRSSARPQSNVKASKKASP
jgi:hypothetical protein